MSVGTSTEGLNQKALVTERNSSQLITINWDSIY